MALLLCRPPLRSTRRDAQGVHLSTTMLPRSTMLSGPAEIPPKHFCKKSGNKLVCDFLVGDVRFGSKADICAAKSNVRFTPNSDRKSGFQSRVMSASPPRADMCSATRDVRFGPKADIHRREWHVRFIRSPRRRGRAGWAALQCQNSAAPPSDKPS
jgi:hypothetical protein